MKLSEILREAKTHIWDGVGANPWPAKTSYTCHAVEQVYLARGCSLSAAQALCKIIEGKIAPYNTYTSWWNAENGIDNETAWAESAESYQTRRLAWVDTLIAELEQIEAQIEAQQESKDENQ